MKRIYKGDEETKGLILLSQPEPSSWRAKVMSPSYQIHIDVERDNEGHYIQREETLPRVGHSLLRKMGPLEVDRRDRPTLRGILNVELSIKRAAREYLQEYVRLTPDPLWLENHGWVCVFPSVWEKVGWCRIFHKVTLTEKGGIQCYSSMGERRLIEFTAPLYSVESCMNVLEKRSVRKVESLLHQRIIPWENKEI